MSYAIVHLPSETVVPQKGSSALTFNSLDRVRFPDGSTADSVPVGHEIPPSYEDGDPVYRVYEVTINETGSGSVATLSDPVFDAQADTVTVTKTLSNPTPTIALVQKECARRLALGFNYDFEDARGVHTIATTDKDMEGWREVTDLANARIATSDTTAITIATETGVCQVTPTEWMDVLKAAAAFRQPIWAYSFVLQAQDPIPADYTDDSHWTESE